MSLHRRLVIPRDGIDKSPLCMTGRTKDGGPSTKHDPGHRNLSSLNPQALMINRSPGPCHPRRHRHPTFENVIFHVMKLTSDWPIACSANWAADAPAKSYENFQLQTSPPPNPSRTLAFPPAEPQLPSQWPPKSPAASSPPPPAAFRMPRRPSSRRRPSATPRLWCVIIPRPARERPRRGLLQSNDGMPAQRAMANVYGSIADPRRCHACCPRRRWLLLRYDDPLTMTSKKHHANC